ncbi:hypothetical protein E2C01_020894 [Portunus trituberculatus]|uniref:Uncharacterized protein n=1 Tax=Portunus trituberculatus TaxID=210409 RepID=A0A5B7E2S5_PORTR|nr:hypothetical protein [Portunus trituberculatus]
MASSGGRESHLGRWQQRQPTDTPCTLSPSILLSLSPFPSLSTLPDPRETAPLELCVLSLTLYTSVSTTVAASMLPPSLPLPCPVLPSLCTGVVPV